MTERRAIYSGSTFEDQIGYARAVVDGDRVHISGTTGFDYPSMTLPDGVVEQAEQCLRNIGWALPEAGCTFADVVRVRYLLPDRDDFEPCWPVLRHYFGDVRPDATMLVAGLADPRMKIEIEVDARRSRNGDGRTPDRATSSQAPYSVRGEDERHGYRVGEEHGRVLGARRASRGHGAGQDPHRPSLRAVRRGGSRRCSADG